MFFPIIGIDRSFWCRPGAPRVWSSNQGTEPFTSEHPREGAMRRRQKNRESGSGEIAEKNCEQCRNAGMSRVLGTRATTEQLEHGGRGSFICCFTCIAKQDRKLTRKSLSR